VVVLVLSFALASASNHQQQAPVKQSQTAASQTDNSQSGTAQASQPSETDSAAVRDALYNREHELWLAEQKHNSDFFQHYLTPDFTFVAFNGMVFTKDKVAEAVSHVDVRNVEVKNVKMHPLDNEVVLLNYDVVIDADVLGQKIPPAQYASSVWVKQGSDWMLAFHQTTPAHHH
jgi:hypothetical protein